MLVVVSKMGVKGGGACVGFGVVWVDVVDETEGWEMGSVSCRGVVEGGKSYWDRNRESS